SRISSAECRLTLSPRDLVKAFHAIAEASSMQWSIHYSRQRKRVGIFVYKFDHCLTDLLWRWKSGELAMDIPFIVSNHRDLEPLAQMYGIPYYYFPARKEYRKHAPER